MTEISLIVTLNKQFNSTQLKCHCSRVQIDWNFIKNKNKHTFFKLNFLNFKLIFSRFFYYYFVEFYNHFCIILASCNIVLLLFIRPSSDGTYYGIVMSVRPSDSPSVRLSVRPGLRPPVFHIFLIHALTY